MDEQRQEPTAAPVTAGKMRIVAQTPSLRVVEYVLQPGDTLSWHHHSRPGRAMERSNDATVAG